MDEFETMESMQRLDHRLQVSERALMEARQHKADLEFFLSETVREATEAEQRAEQARELLTSLEHRQEVQRRELQHWERLAAEAQQTATEATEELSNVLNIGRTARNNLNESATGFIDRLFGAMPWSVTIDDCDSAESSTDALPKSSDELALMLTKADSQLEAIADRIALTATSLLNMVGPGSEDLMTTPPLQKEM